MPIEFSLEQNYPNPFNPSTTIEFQLPEREFVTLKVYDVMGNEIAEILKGVVEAGTHSAKFNASSLASGIYFYQLATEKFTDTKKFILLK